jgi:hypothetical protein
MKTLIKALAVALVFSAPVASFAQSNQPLTRSEVRAQLIQVEKAGYNPATANDNDYPANIQAAEARVAGQNTAASADTSGVGGVVSGSSGAGSHAYRSEAERTGPQSIYFGH